MAILVPNNVVIDLIFSVQGPGYSGLFLFPCLYLVVNKDIYNVKYKTKR